MPAQEVLSEPPFTATISADEQPRREPAQCPVRRIQKTTESADGNNQVNQRESDFALRRVARSQEPPCNCSFLVIDDLPEDDVPGRVERNERGRHRLGDVEEYVDVVDDRRLDNGPVLLFQPDRCDPILSDPG